MPKPLQVGDPAELGPFRLESRLHESAAGIVYLAVDPQGRRVEVALLTTAAAGDAAARDRFRAAVEAESPRVGAFPSAARPADPGGPSPVVAALSDGGAPWVATAHEEGRAGAERFLKPVLLERGWGMGRRLRGGPSFQQYWLSGPKGPALQPPPAPATVPAAARDSKGLAAAVASLAALLVLLGLLVLLLYSCEPSPKPPKPTEVPTTVPVQPPPPPQPSPSSPLPSPSPSGKKSKTPQPSRTGGPGTINPAAHGGPVAP
ncbi:hypothetical protein [Actinoallomurus iriomotensis]|uniref:Serine/threonine protein kinase n=1 Tax=Actinoallomurus iriomotensis TaxID=478107 RepID=A0A9W6RHQ8_9ACTN|nr:hypothetical protein [Actinoallomurus iriomotensis]GLY76276.1 hypothetical protein Airi01_045430 [Actinoallomurus iriomotensis]